MGNIQPIVTPLFVSRPYDSTCKSIAQTLPVTNITSYQRPSDTSPSEDPDCGSSAPPNPHSLTDGCCFSPTQRNFESQSGLVKQESFWEYGECLGMAADEDTKIAEYSNESESATAATTPADDNDEKLTSKIVRPSKDRKKSFTDPTIIASRSLVKIPVCGSVSNHKPFLEPQILDHLLPFILDASLAKCLSVCPHWLRMIYGHLRHKVEPILESFQRVYCQEGRLEYESCSLNIQPIFTAAVAAVRIDLLIYCRVSRQQVGISNSCCENL